MYNTELTRPGDRLPALLATPTVTAAIEKCRAFAERTGDEYGIILSPDLRSTVCEKAGDDHSVDWGPICHTWSGCLCIHSHPGDGGSLSPQDAMLAGEYVTGGCIAADVQGSIYFTLGLSDAKMLAVGSEALQRMDLRSNEIRVVAQWLQMHGQISMYEATMGWSHLQMLVAERMGLLRYEFRLSPQGAAAVQKFNDIIKREFHERLSFA